MIPQNTIESIKEAADIVDVIGQFVDLKKHGKDYRGLSPFSNEKTPSFFVVTTKGRPFYKDFSSGKAGDVISFLMEYNTWSYTEAIKYLATRQGISLDNSKTPTPTISVKEKKELVENKPVFIEGKWMERSLKSTHLPNNFLAFIESKFGCAKMEEVRNRFNIGYSNWRPGACVFWYIDEEKRICRGKLMMYDELTGKRYKGQFDFSSVHARLSKQKLIPENYQAKRTLFGLHQIIDSKVSAIGLVESEKTACICSVMLPSITWMAVGGKDGLDEQLLRPISNFPILAYPDADGFEKWSKEVETLRQKGFRITISRLSMDYQSHNPKVDIADLLLECASMREPEYDLSGTMIHPEKGYPTSWDIKIPTKLDQLIATNPLVRELINRLDLVEA